MDDRPAEQFYCQQVLSLLADFSQFGRLENGGITRLAGSAEDKLARDYLCSWFERNGFDIRIDQIGNIFGLIALSQDKTDQNFFCGSHLDSQPNGGRFDGALGVACACATGLFVRDAVRSGQIEPAYQTYVVACWTGEEGARFQPSLLGSSTFSGAILPDEALSIRDGEGTTLGQVLGKIGYCGSASVPQPTHYFELHVEQGTKLQDAFCPVGLVENCWGASKFTVEITGRPDHTGPTPMNIRRDAMLAASHLIVRINDLPKELSSTLHSSVGRIEVAPNSPNTVADRVRLWVEVRSDDEAALSDAQDDIGSALTEIAAMTGCSLRIIRTDKRDAIEFDKDSLIKVGSALQNAGMHYRKLSTIAGHDAVAMQSICPSTLMFVPSKDGISHSPEEFTSGEDIAAGFKGMLHAVSSLISVQDDVLPAEVVNA